MSTLGATMKAPGKAEWLERMRGMPVLEVALTLGVAELGSPSSAWALSPCPACGAERRHTKSADRRGAVGVAKDNPGGWHCFQCDASGDAVDFVAYRLGGNKLRELPEHRKAEVREWCQRWLGMSPGTPNAPRTQPKPVQGPSQADQDRHQQEDAEHAERCEVFTALFERLELGGAGVPYLAGRGLSHPRHGFAAASAFGARYLDPADAPALVSELGDRFGTDTLERIGLTSQGRWRFDATPLLFPLHDSQGRLGWFQGRSVASDSLKERRWNSPKGAGASRCLYNARALADKTAPVWLCEGPTDVVAALVWSNEITRELGHPFIPVGKAGTGKLSPHQVALLKGRDVLVTYDGDQAGEQGVPAAASVLRSVTARLRRLPVPEGLDLSEWINERRKQWEA